jgi:cyclic beta-1,2-glucan synthetase
LRLSSLRRLTKGLWVPPEAPSSTIRGELLSLEGLEARARALAARFTVARNPRPRARDFFARLEDDARALRLAYRTILEDSRGTETGIPAAEWLLDNFHVVEQEIADVRRNLPRRYYLELPKIASREHADTARVLAMARELLRHSDGRLDFQRLTRFLAAYQTLAPLTIGELWAWPTMLKVALIEGLRRISEEMLGNRAARIEADRLIALLDRARSARGVLEPRRDLPTAFSVQVLQRLREYGPPGAELRARIEESLADRGMTPEDAIRAEHQLQAANQISMGNLVTSLRLCGSLDWSQFFEHVSLVEHALQGDPAAVYGKMDFASRDRYRHAVEELAEPSGEAQVRVALRCVESARQALELDPEDRRAHHVGHHLIGKGRRDLEIDTAHVPKARSRIRRLFFGHAEALYLGTLAVVTAGLVALGLALVLEGRFDPAVAALLAIPASECAVAFLRWVAVRFAPPRRLPRLDLRGGVPEEGRTMVIVPTLLPSVEAVRARLEHLEVQALANLDPRIHFAILGDFVDAPSAEAPGDAAIVAEARAGIEALNARHGGGDRSSSTARGGGIRRKAAGWAGSASAARSRSSIASWAGTRARATASRSVTSPCSRGSASASRSTPTPAFPATRRSS